MKNENDIIQLSEISNESDKAAEAQSKQRVADFICQKIVKIAEKHFPDQIEAKRAGLIKSLQQALAEDDPQDYARLLDDIKYNQQKIIDSLMGKDEPEFRDADSVRATYSDIEKKAEELFPGQFSTPIQIKIS